MKNRHTTLLILVTCVFACFTLGFLAGRAGSSGDVIISRLEAPTQPSSEASAAVDQERSVEATAPPSGQTGLININNATASQLETLPGIGPVLSQRIIDYREENGPFKAVSQLTLVEGIGEKRLTEILDLITVE